MDPLHQFHIEPIVEVVVGNVDLSFSNAALWMLLAAASVYALMTVGMRPGALVPGRLQSLVEMFYQFTAKTVRDNAGPDARPYVPFVFTLFSFILFGNMLGMIPGSFTFTSHLIVTFSLAVVVITFVTILGFVKHGLHFLTFFMPHGAPWVLAPLLVPLEVISYLTRPISLSVRLFANMMAGHTMLKVFAGFSVMMVAGMGKTTGVVAAMGPVMINVALTGFEILVAALQAYVFAILTCLYIRDALELH